MKRAWLLLSLSIPFLLILIDGTWSKALALEPGQVLVVANDSSPESLALSSYYIKKRNIPRKNLLHIRCTTKEVITRRAFERDIAFPLKKALAGDSLLKGIRCILLTYGIPLRILEKQESGTSTKGPSAKRKGTGRDIKEEGSKKRMDERGPLTTVSSVDSEVMAIRLYGRYDLKSWLLNPLYIGKRPGKRPSLPAKEIVMVSRIDGPDLRNAKRIIDDAIFSEENGLSGRACLDCRYTASQRKMGKDTYHLFDRWIYQAALFLKSRGFETKINQGPGLFEKYACKGCAIYCGWYSLSNYKDAFTWKRGAIGYHIASGECVSLHGNTRQWCRMILKKGASVTIGPVSEPYVQAFPPPNLFFRLLLDNGLSISEAYLFSCPMLSWQMVLVGDPLYRPFLRLRLDNTKR